MSPGRLRLLRRAGFRSVDDSGSAETTVATDPSNITVIEYGDSFLGWDYRASDELNTIRKELHLSIRFQKHLLAMGEQIRKSKQLHGGAYIGVHLRGESDWPADWGNAEQQKMMYADEMSKIRAMGSDVSAVFVSSGDQGAIQRFREMLEPLGYVVHDKWTIMEELNEQGELSEIEELDFDSKGIVDYAVLAGARFFMGVRTSSTRHTTVPAPPFPVLSCVSHCCFWCHER